MSNADMAGLKIVAFVLTAGFVWTLYLLAHPDSAACQSGDAHCKQSSPTDPPAHLRGTAR